MRGQRQRLASLESTLRAYSPNATLERGYAIITRGDKVIRRHDEVAAGDSVVARLKAGKLTAIIEHTEPDND